MSHLQDGSALAPTSAEERATDLDDRRCDIEVGEPTAVEASASASGEASPCAEGSSPAPVGQPGSSSDILVASTDNEKGAKAKSIVDEIGALKQKQKEARDLKKQISKDLRNAEKRRQRLKKRARQLTDADLVAVMTLRAREKEVNAAGAAGLNSFQDTEETETGSATSPSTAASGDGRASQSPLQASKRHRSA